MACAVLLGLLTQVPASSPSSTRTQELQESSPSLQQLISLFDYLQVGNILVRMSIFFKYYLISKLCV